MNKLSPDTPAAKLDKSAPIRNLDTPDKIAIVVIGILSITAGVLAGLFNPLLNRAASVEGARIDALFSTLLGVAAAIFVLVQAILIYAIIRYGRFTRGTSRPAEGERLTPEEEEDEGPPMRGNLPLEIAWTAVPVAIVTALSIYSFIVLRDIEQPQSNQLIVEVIGRQFSWEFRYPDLGITSNELHVPLNRQIALNMHSEDVIHAFWVPEFRMKKDLMPDQVTHTWFTPKRLGTYPLICSRLCGIGHAFMRTNVVVHEATDFDNWVTQQRQQGQTGGTTGQDVAVVGRQLFQKYGCNGCHALKDAGATGQVGPALDGIASHTAHAGTAEEFIHESIVNPNAEITEGYPANLMPRDYARRIPPQDLDALVQYLLLQK